MSSVLNNSQFQQLNAIAQTAKGSWFCERKSGGSGYMGSFVDKMTGQTHYAKFAIHGNERKDLVNDMAHYGDKLKLMTDSLLSDLAKLAVQVGVSKEFNALLKDRDMTFPDLVTRKFVAKSVSLIADAHNKGLSKSGSGSVPTFSWKNVARLKAEDDTSVVSVYSDVEKLTKTRDKGLRSDVTHDFSTAGTDFDEQVNSAFNSWKQEGFTFLSDHIGTIGMALDKGYLPDDWKCFLPNKLPANHKEGLTLTAYQDRIIEKLRGGNPGQVMDTLRTAINDRVPPGVKMKELIEQAQEQVDLEVCNGGRQDVKSKSVQENKQLPIELKGDQGLFDFLDRLNGKSAQLGDKGINDVWPHIMGNPANEVRISDLKDLLQTYKDVNEVLGELEKHQLNKEGQKLGEMGIMETERNIQVYGDKLDYITDDVGRLLEKKNSCTDDEEKKKIEKELDLKNKDLKATSEHLRKLVLHLQTLKAESNGPAKGSQGFGVNFKKKVGALLNHLNQHYSPGAFSKTYVDNGLIDDRLVDKLKGLKGPMQNAAFAKIRQFQTEETDLERRARADVYFKTNNITDKEKEERLKTDIESLQSKLGDDFDVATQNAQVAILEHLSKNPTELFSVVKDTQKYQVEENRLEALGTLDEGLAQYQEKLSAAKRNKDTNQINEINGEISRLQKKKEYINNAGMAASFVAQNFAEMNQFKLPKLLQQEKQKLDDYIKLVKLKGEQEQVQQSFQQPKPEVPGS